MAAQKAAEETMKFTLSAFVALLLLGTVCVAGRAWADDPDIYPHDGGDFIRHHKHTATVPVEPPHPEEKPAPKEEPKPPKVEVKVRPAPEPKAEPKAEPKPDPPKEAPVTSCPPKTVEVPNPKAHEQLKIDVSDGTPQAFEAKKRTGEKSHLVFNYVSGNEVIEDVKTKHESAIVYDGPALNGPELTRKLRELGFVQVGEVALFKSELAGLQKQVNGIQQQQNRFGATLQRYIGFFWNFRTKKLPAMLADTKNQAVSEAVRQSEAYTNKQIAAVTSSVNNVSGSVSDLDTTVHAVIGIGGILLLVLVVGCIAGLIFLISRINQLREPVLAIIKEYEDRGYTIPHRLVRRRTRPTGTSP